MHQQQIEQLIYVKHRRLEILESQKAQQGFHTPPHIITEIEDLKVEIEALEHQRDKIRRESGDIEQGQQSEAAESNPAPKPPSTSEPEPTSDTKTSQPTGETPAIPTSQPKIADSKTDTLTLSEPFQMEFIHIPAGEFLMGSDPAKDKDAANNEQPQHSVYLPDYYIAKTPVTNAQYAAFVKATRHDAHKKWNGGNYPHGGGSHPAVFVSWHDAVAFCRWLSEESGQTVRLPTEAEWEKAARGTDGRIYPWGDEWDESRSGKVRRGLASLIGFSPDTTPVGQYSPQGDSPYGCVDMAGNVWERCSTVWQKAYPFQVQDEWTEAYLSKARVRMVRGGSRDGSRQSVRCAYRRGGSRGNRRDDFGFRVVVSPS